MFAICRLDGIMDRLLLNMLNAIHHIQVHFHFMQSAIAWVNISSDDDVMLNDVFLGCSVHWLFDYIE